MGELRPESEAEVAEAVAEAAAKRAPLEIVGHGTRRHLGRPLQVADALVIDGLSGVSFHEPEELVFAAAAGTPLADIETMLAERGQMLAFEPPRLARLLGAETDETGTLGGMVAAGLAGPRRLRAGGVRDHLLGFRAVNGCGEIFKSGGRVMKNVTGYDLSKLMCGSWGTLAVLTELTFKVLPRPEVETTLVWHGLSEERAVALMTTALRTPWEISGAAHLPAGVRTDGEETARTARTLLRLDGFAGSVQARAEALTAALADFGTPAGTVEAEASAALWRAIRDVAPFVAESDRTVWRISCPPAAGARIVARLRAAFGDALHCYMDWGGGLIWLSLPAPAGVGGAIDLQAAIRQAKNVRAALNEDGGHATLIRGPEDMRRHVAVFQPMPDVLARLHERVRASFDPAGILNPGRMHAGAGD